jgi:integrase
MARRKTLSDLGVAALKPQAKLYTFPDPELRGHYVRVMPSGVKSFAAISRGPDGKQKWVTLGASDKLKVEEARELARAAIQRVKQGLPATEARPNTFKEVAENYLKRHVTANGLLSEGEIRRCLDKYVYPTWADREFTSVRRVDVATLLDDVQDNNGKRQADYVLAIVRGICNWFATRDDDYVSPIVRGMRRTDPKSRKRERILDDEELRAVWKQAEAGGTFGVIVRLCLLTAQRREKIAAMKWDDISVDGVWRIPQAEREKGTAGDLKLPDAALAVIREQTRFGSNPYVLPGRGEGHFNGFSPCKRAFDKQVSIAPWVIHDLRRTARSLMSRASVKPHVAERVMGHVLAGVEGVYDRHEYFDEKADALARLATLLSSIIEPSDKVVPIRSAAR